MTDDPTSVFAAVGGDVFFSDLVDRFYDAVAGDPVLRPLYPDDLSESRRGLALFLAQYWGGPPRYSEEKGHPRLRMRHVGIEIGEAERDHWYAHMVDAVRALAPGPEIEAAMVDYFAKAATHMINTGLDQFRPPPG